MGGEADFDLSWLYDKVNLSFNIKSCEAKSGRTLPFNKCQAPFITLKSAVQSGVRRGLKARVPRRYTAYHRAPSTCSSRSPARSYRARGMAIKQINLLWNWRSGFARLACTLIVIRLNST